MALYSCYGFSQCDGPDNGGVAVYLTDANPFSSTVGTDDYIIEFESTAPGNIVIRSTTGLQFLVDAGAMNTLINVMAGDDIAAGMNWSSGPAILYNNSSHSGPFGFGNSGFIGIRKGDRYGWIELGPCGSTTCDPNAYEFPVLDRCINGVSGGSVIAGNSGALTALTSNAIPTLSEWGLIIMTLFISIIALVSIKSLEQQKSYS